MGAVYAEVDSSVRASERLQFFAHLGALTPFAGGVSYYRRREQYDMRVGAALLFRGAELSLAWTFLRPGYGYVGERPDALVVTATSFF